MGKLLNYNDKTCIALNIKNVLCIPDLTYSRESGYNISMTGNGYFQDKYMKFCNIFILFYFDVYLFHFLNIYLNICIFFIPNIHISLTLKSLPIARNIIS